MTTICSRGLMAIPALALGLSAGPAVTANAAEVEGPKVTWTVSLWGTQRAHTEGVEGLANHIAEKTDGNFTMDLQYGGVLSDPAENIDGLQLGAFEAGQVCSFYHPGKLPISSGLNLPMLPLPTLEIQHKVYDEFLRHPAVLEEWATWNAIPLLSVLMPNYEAMGRGTPPTDLASWQGVRVNASGGHSQLMEALGAVPTTVPAPDIYSSMERGALDAVVYPYTYAFATYSLHELSTWQTDTWNLGTVHCALAANLDAYNDLPDQYKQLLAEGNAPAYAHQISEFAKVDAENEVLFAERNLTKVQITDEIRDALKSVVQSSWDAWVADMNGRGVPGQELLDLILSKAEAAGASQ